MTPFYKIPGLLLLPSATLILLLVVALLAKGRLRQVSVIAALGLTCFGSISALSGPLLEKTERSIPLPAITTAPDYIVALGNGHVTNPALPLVGQLYPAALARITQAVILAKQFPSARLVFTGYAGGDPVSAADKGAELAIALGIAEPRILRFSSPRNTQEEAEVTASLLTGKHVLLVTSASHLPRAIAAFNAAGVDVTGYPTGHLQKLNKARGWHDYWPQATNWLAFERWVYEQLAGLRQRYLP